MGERTAIRFVNGEEKSVWLYFHYYADYHAVSQAVAFIQGLPKDPTDGRRGDPTGVVATYLRHLGDNGPERVFHSTTDYGRGEGMDWGAWDVDIHTGIATSLDGLRMTHPDQYDSDEGVWREPRSIKDDSKRGSKA